MGSMGTKARTYTPAACLQGQRASLRDDNWGPKKKNPRGSKYSIIRYLGFG